MKHYLPSGRQQEAAFRNAFRYAAMDMVRRPLSLLGIATIPTLGPVAIAYILFSLTSAAVTFFTVIFASSFLLPFALSLTAGDLWLHEQREELRPAGQNQPFWWRRILRVSLVFGSSQTIAVGVGVFLISAIGAQPPIALLLQYQTAALCITLFTGFWLSIPFLAIGHKPDFNTNFKATISSIPMTPFAAAIAVIIVLTGIDTLGIPYYVKGFLFVPPTAYFLALSYRTASAWLVPNKPAISQ